MAWHLQANPVIPSDQSQYVYRLLLNGVKVTPYLGNDAYKAMCSKKGKLAPLPAPELDEPPPLEPPPSPDEDLVVVGTGAEEPPAKKRKGQKPVVAPLEFEPSHVPPLVKAKPPSTGASGSSGSGGGSGAPADDPPPPLPPPPPPPPAPPLAHEHADASDADEDLVVGVPERAKFGPNAWQDAWDGAKWCFKPYTTPTGKRYPNYKIKCATPDICGKSCQKTKGANAPNVRRHGIIGPLAFLFAWRRSKPLAGETHGHHDPTDAEVDAIAARHKDELEELARQVADAV